MVGRAVVLSLALALVSVGAACTTTEADEAASAADQLASADEGSDVGGADGTPPTVPETFFDGSVTVVVPNSPGTLSTVGRQRVMAALVGNGPNAYLGGPDLAITVRYSFIDEDGITGDVEAEWLTTNASQLGLYVAPFSFERAGLWQVTVLADEREVGGALIEVVDESVVPNIGDPAPAVATPTASDPIDLVAISTDPFPEPGFYDLSLDEALANGRPTVVAFATPAFCRTALCGPALETVKAATAGRDDLDVVHVEPFDIEQAIGGTLEPIPAMVEWGLVTEPWVFIVDADGVVAAGFEGIIAESELAEALAGL